MLITLGSPPKHVWTYVVRFTDGAIESNSNCPCDDAQGFPAYDFIRNHYYCESVSRDTISDQSFYTIVLLWDGRGCVGAENSCCAKVAISVATGCRLDDLAIWVKWVIFFLGSLGYQDVIKITSSSDLIKQNAIDNLA